MDRGGRPRVVDGWPPCAPGPSWPRAAGLLDGRTVTTHWASATRLAAEFPALRVDPDPIYIRDGAFWTSAGVTAGIDLALALVEDDLGSEVAQTVARWLVMFLHRPGGQTQFASPVWVPRADRSAVRAVQGMVESSPGGDHRLPAMAAAAAMSVRHFARVFHREVGETPGRFVERARLEAARHELETSDATLEAIAGRCGFGTAETMRRVFQRRLNVSPDSYRRRFRVSDRREVGVSDRLQVAIPLFPRFTALDAVGPYEVFQRVPSIDVVIIGHQLGELRSDNGMLGVTVDATFEEVDEPDVVVFPGGIGTRALVDDERVLEWVRHAHTTTRLTTSVCTGSIVLAAAGLLVGLPATTHWSCYAELESHRAVPTARRVVEHLDRRIITAAGVSSGIDMALRVVELVVDTTAAQAAQLMIEYDPEPPFDCGSVAKSTSTVMTRVVEYAEHRQ